MNLVPSRSNAVLAGVERSAQRRQANVAARVGRLRRLAHWLDAAFRIPGTRRRIGLESLVGVVPVIGDLVTTIPAAVILIEAARLGARRRVLSRMVINIGLDSTVGAIPLLGDLFDVAFKANLKNVELLEEHLERTADCR